MAASSILPLTVPLGTQVFGPVTAPAGWTKVVFTLDIAGLTSTDLLIESSEDGGTTWQSQAFANGMIPVDPATLLPITTMVFTVLSPDGEPSTLVRATLTNGVVFLSTGGSLVVT